MVSLDNEKEMINILMIWHSTAFTTFHSSVFIVYHITVAFNAEHCGRTTERERDHLCASFQTNYLIKKNDDRRSCFIQSCFILAFVPWQSSVESTRIVNAIPLDTCSAKLYLSHSIVFLAMNTINK